VPNFKFGFGRYKGSRLPNWSIAAALYAAVFWFLVKTADFNALILKLTFHWHLLGYQAKLLTLFYVNESMRLLNA
jgi:hypothetical protein